MYKQTDKGLLARTIWKWKTFEVSFKEIFQSLSLMSGYPFLRATDFSQKDKPKISISMCLRCVDTFFNIFNCPKRTNPFGSSPFWNHYTKWNSKNNKDKCTIRKNQYWIVKQGRRSNKSLRKRIFYLVGGVQRTSAENVAGPFAYRFSILNSNKHFNTHTHAE